MAFIRSKKLRGVTYYAIVESQRDGGKVRQRVIAPLGRSPEPLASIAHYLTSAEWTSPDERTARRFKDTWLRGWTRRACKQRRIDGDFIDPYTGRHRVPEPDAKALRDCEKAWQEELANRQAKHAECLRIAREIENFAKRGMDEAAWTAKRDAYLKERKAEWDAMLAQFSRLA